MYRSKPMYGTWHKEYSHNENGYRLKSQGSINILACVKSQIYSKYLDVYGTITQGDKHWLGGYTVIDDCGINISSIIQYRA